MMMDLLFWISLLYAFSAHVRCCSSFVTHQKHSHGPVTGTTILAPRSRVAPINLIRPSNGRLQTELGVVAIIDDWKVLTNGRVVGRVRSHPSIPDGQSITTSPLVKPDTASKNKVVLTASGSKYKLANPAMAQPEPVNGKSAPVVSLQELQRRARQEKGLTGEVIGDDSRQYLLAGQPVKSTSGKSKIYIAYRSNGNGLPEGDPLTVKLSANWEALEREASNYNTITKAGMTRGQFVTLVDYLPKASVITKSLSGLSALVIERGTIDMKKYIAVNGPLQGKELRDAAAAAAQCLQAVHGSGLVWTDLKTENFVVTKEGQVKGIDLESAMPVKDNPVDYSPEATPPEFAKAFLDGDGPYFTLEYNYDMWSLGMMLYEISTGTGYWEGKTPVQITKALREQPKIDLSKVTDPKLKDLIGRCTDLDPKRRPSIYRVLLHPYFISTGIGPFALFI